MSEAVPEAVVSPTTEPSVDSNEKPHREGRKPRQPKKKTEREKLSRYDRDMEYEVSKRYGLKRPEFNEFLEKKQKVRDQIMKIREEIKKISEEFEKPTEKEDKLTPIWDKINVHRERANVLKAHKAQINEWITAANEKFQTAKQEQKEMQEQMGTFKDVESIDRTLAELEFELHSTTLSKTSEQKLVSKIASLTNKKRFFEDKDSLDYNVKNALAGLKYLYEVLNQKKAEHKKEREILDKLYAEVSTIKESREKTNSKFTKLKEKRKKLYGDIDRHNSKLEKLDEEFDQSIKEYNEKKKEYIAAIEEEQKKAALEYEEAKKNEEAAKLKEKEEMEKLVKQNPFQHEIATCDNLIVYLEKITRSKPKEAEKKKAAITHPMNIFEGFDFIKVSIPANAEEAEQTLKVVKKKRSQFVAQNKKQIRETKESPVEPASENVPEPVAAN